jgi:hypothetical protein
MYKHIDKVLQPFLSAVSQANAQLSACVWSRPSVLQHGSLALQDAEKVRQRKKTVVWFVWSVWFFG